MLNIKGKVALTFLFERYDTMENIDEKEQNESMEGRDETSMTPVTPLVQDPGKEMTDEEKMSEGISGKDQNEQSVSGPKQPTYQHTKVYQDSEGRFIIEERLTQEIHEEEKEDTCEEKSSVPGEGQATKKKEQALRYLEAFASSVAEEMKKQAAQQDEEENSEDYRGNVTTVVFNNNERTVERKGVASTLVQNMAQIAMNADEDGQDDVVTVVIADDVQEEREGEETSTAEEANRQNLAKSLSSLRRSKRKRRSKKRHYDDDDEGDEEDADRKEDKGGDETGENTKDAGKIQKLNDYEISEKEKPSKVLKPKNKRLNQVFDCACGKVFPTNSQLRQHLRTHTTLKPHKCVFCGKCFRQKCQKDKHERIHTGSKPYKCRHCDRAFSESGSRNRHERIHTGYKPYQCQHCEKTFIQKGNKDAHEKIHTTFKPFKCDNENCTETFETEEEVRRHKEGHPQRPYKCHFCCKSFPFNAERKRHERCHTGVKPYKCGYCERSFTQKGNKDNHERTHTGKKPHLCQYCPRAFIRRQYLEKHQKKKHGKDNITVTSEANRVYELVEMDPKLLKDGKIAAESLLTAAQIVANHQAAIQNGMQKGEGDAAGNLQAQEIGQVMAEVNQQLSSVEHHMAIVEHDGMQHQVQVVQHHQIGGELPSDGHITVVDGQIVEEHEVIGIQNQVVVTQQEVLDSVGADGHVIIQHHIPSEDVHMTIVEHQIPISEENIIVSEPQEVAGDDHCDEEGQEFRIGDTQQVVQEELTDEKHILVTSSQGNEEEDQQKLAEEDFIEGHRVLITPQHKVVVRDTQQRIDHEQHNLVPSSEPQLVDADHQIEEQLLLGEQQGEGESQNMMACQSETAEEGQELVAEVQVDGQGQDLVTEGHQQGDQIEGIIEGQDVKMT